MDATGNAYVSGWTLGDLASSSEGRSDIFLRKYAPSGDVEWTRQFGTSGYDGSMEIAADGLGGVYITGNTSGDLVTSNSGAADVFVMKFDLDGSLVWQDQFGAVSSDFGAGLAFGENGDVYVTGSTVVGSLPEVPNFANEDIFLRKYSSDGDLEWESSFGTGGFKQAYDVAHVGLDMYVLGRAWAQYDSDGSRMDAIVYKVVEVSEPACIVLLVGMAISSCLLRARQNAM